MRKTFLGFGAALAGLAVILGAFGAHEIKEIAPDSAAIWKTGAEYQMYHALALITLALVYEKIPGKLLLWAGRLFLFGTLFFSGSLYLLTILKINGGGLGVAALITPLGGLCFIAGWLLFLLGVLKKNR
jgi:uncharacterized membrane protein YgdD (TMEM256/DUF423 family)